MLQRLTAWSVPVSAGALAVLISLLGLLKGADEALYDQMVTRLVPPPEAPGAILVAIDEPSLAEFGPWPWPRAAHGALVESLRAAGAGSIAFDVLFADPGDLADDGAFIAAAGPDVVLARDVEIIETPQGRIRTEVMPLPELIAFGARTGSVAMPIDFDGAMRRMPAQGGFTPEIAQRDAAPDGARIAWAGPPGSYPRVSYYQAVDAKASLPPGFFEGADVIVGFALRAVTELDGGVPDHFRTPWTPRGFGMMPGIEVHANALDTLRLERWIIPLGHWFVVLAAGGIAFLTAWATSGRSAALAVCITLVAALTPVATSAAALTSGVWLPPATWFAGAIFGGIGQTLRDYAHERRLRATVTTAFGRYLSPALVERLAQDPSALKLGGEKRHITVMFCDLRGFTAISEAMKDDPEGLTRLVNRLLTPIADAILEHDGTIDKFIGDCVMGIWNAPLDIDNHAQKAIDAAVQIVADIDRLSETIMAERKAAGLTDLGVACGVGINSGPCVVGNMGTSDRFDYTAIGDPVNLSARLEARTKYYGLRILIGEDTARDTNAHGLIQVDRVAVKGRATPVDIYTPVCALTDDATVDLAARQSCAFGKYRSRDWAASAALWGELAQDAPIAAHYSKVMIVRSNNFAAHNPCEDWDGTWQFDEK
ncbi:CHASE2 domain-containing protein [Puniceibacterium sediminis]|uniref:CHASE2 domain-containing protein n=1 Tax=Puniceibacterium sediminis TaxID=1608407 RepID=UPI0015958BF7|nr:adenylate/guanylate cyclase domain-containing protein [Puniceibacterium sediminis]